MIPPFRVDDSGDADPDAVSDLLPPGSSIRIIAGNKLDDDPHILICRPDLSVEAKIVSGSASGSDAGDDPRHLCVQPLRVVKVTDEKFAVSAYNPPYTMCIFDAETKTCIQKLEGCQSHAYALGVIEATGSFADTPRIVTSDHSLHCALIWNSETGESVAKLPDTPPAPYSILSIPEFDNHVYIGGAGVGGSAYPIQQYDCVKNTLMSGRKGHKSYVNGLAGDPVLGLLCSAGFGFEARVWDIRQAGKAIHVLSSSSSSRLFACATVPDRSLLLAGTTRGVNVWDLRKPETPLRFMQTNAGDVDSAILRLSPTVFTSAGKDISLWTLSGKIIKSQKDYRSDGQYMGLATLGSPFDHPRCSVSSLDAKEWAERLEFIRESELTTACCRWSRCVVAGVEKELFVLPPWIIVQSGR